MNGELLDDFGEVAAWQSIAPGRTHLAIAPAAGPTGRALRLDFDFGDGGGFVVARRACSPALPERYALSFLLRGAAIGQGFELKLVDVSGHNVWRYRLDDWRVPAHWQRVLIASREIAFAWGPLGGGPPRHITAIEFAILAGAGGRGWIELADLRLHDESYRAVPTASASSARPGHPPAAVLDPVPDSSWRSAGEGPQWLALDLGEERELGALAITWEPALAARDFAIDGSADGEEWTTLAAVDGAAGARHYVRLPAKPLRHLRVRCAHGATEAGFGIRRLELEGPAWGASREAFFAGIASEARPGLYPKHLVGRQSNWTTVPLPAGGPRALMNEEGMVEVDTGDFSLEPFVYANGRLHTWADVGLARGLAGRWLPLPRVRWQHADFALTVTAGAAGTPGSGALYCRYRLENPRNEPLVVRLYVVARPFQVTPAWQRFRDFGGCAPLHAVAVDGIAMRVDGHPAMWAAPPPSGGGAATFAAGGLLEELAHGALPATLVVGDRFGAAAGAFAFDRTLAPGERQDVYVTCPFIPAGTAHDGRPPPPAAAGLARAARHWKAVLGNSPLRLPRAAANIVDTLRVAAAHILGNRAGAALHPGPRRYARAWLRDGVMMGTALARLGITAPLRDFLRWYVKAQAADGTLPDCVDAQGPEWLPEHDAYGELAFGAMVCHRFHGDREFLRALWPAVDKGLDCLTRLRGRRLGADYRTPERRACYGLLPDSMSHEGYMAHPVHAYWDDFWALRGLDDGAALAATLHEDAAASRLAALRDAFGNDLRDSIAATRAAHRIDFVPGSVELGDFDPAALAVALGPLDLLHLLPRGAVERSFERYLAHFRERARTNDWNNYSAYEIRIVGALVRLGWREAAIEVLTFMLRGQRPEAWRQWPEITWRDPSTPSFLGDLPHTWISAEFILAALSCFAYERDADRSLVIAAGIAGEWLADGLPIEVRALPTPHGPLSYTLRRVAPGTLRLDLAPGIVVPAGGIVVRPPLRRALRSVRIDDRTLTEFAAGEFVCRDCPAAIVIEA